MRFPFAEQFRIALKPVGMLALALLAMGSIAQVWDAVTASGSVAVDGGVRTIGQPVPDRAALIVEAWVRPQDADRLNPGQAARVALPVPGRQVALDIPGTVTSVSPEHVRDPRSGASWHRIRVRLDPAALRVAPGVVLKAGMPAQVFIQTGNRSVLSFLLGPLLGRIRRAFEG